MNICSRLFVSLTSALSVSARWVISGSTDSGCSLNEDNDYNGRIIAELRTCEPSRHGLCCGSVLVSTMTWK
eukprot:3769713-Amphidinium_carterae.1